MQPTIKVSCIYCNKQFITRKKSENYPYCCSRNCIKNVENYEDLLISSRGFPRGYHSKEEYDLFLFNNEMINKNCIICGSVFIQKRNGTGVCSPNCIKEKRKQTCLEKYGYEHPHKNPIVKNKVKQTWLEIYGCDNPQKNKEVKKKTQETCLKKYGNINHLNNSHYEEKRKQICLEKYGVDNFFKRKDLVVESYQNKYGDNITHPSQVKQVMDKCYNTRKQKYDDLFGCVPREITEETCLERYGNRYFFGSEAGKMTVENLKKNYNWDDDEIDELIQKKCNPKRFSNGTSKESLKYFIPFFHTLLKCGLQENDIYFGFEDKNELFLSNNGIRGFFDFAILPWKVIVEFHGRLFHPKTDELSEQELREWNLPFKKGRTGIEQAKRDLQKQQLAESLGYEYYVLWDSNEEKDNKDILTSILQKHLS